MSIQNELSSEIAVALLARGGKDPEQLKKLRELIFRIRATLQRLPRNVDKTELRTRATSANQRIS